MVMAAHTPLSALDPHSPVRLFPDDEFRVVNAVDASKQLAFDLSAVATGATRTVTIPDASGTMALLERAQTFTKLATFALGLTVAGAAFASRGIQDDATARALTLSGSGENSVTIANSASNPSLGTTAGNLTFTPFTGAGVLSGGSKVAIHYCQNNANTSGAWFGVDAAGHAYAWNGNAAAGISNFHIGNGSTNNTGSLNIYAQGRTQVQIPAVVDANRYITLAGSNGGNPYVGTNLGHLLLYPNSGTVYISAGANSAIFSALNTANPLGVSFGTDYLGHAYAYNYNNTAGASHFLLGNQNTANTGYVYVYQKGAQRLVVSDTEVVANGTTTMILRAKGGSSYGMVAAESPLGFGAYFLAVVAGVETARMYSSADGWAFATGSGAALQLVIAHTASTNHWVVLTGSNGGNPRIHATNAGGSDNLTLGTGSALATNATVGHICIPSCAGTPTGVPTGAGAGNIPLIYDTTNNKIYAYNGAWKATAALT